MRLALADLLAILAPLGALLAVMWGSLGHRIDWVEDKTDRIATRLEEHIDRVEDKLDRLTDRYIAHLEHHS